MKKIIYIIFALLAAAPAMFASSDNVSFTFASDNLYASVSNNGVHIGVNRMSRPDNDRYEVRLNKGTGNIIISTRNFDGQTLKVEVGDRKWVSTKGLNKREVDRIVKENNRNNYSQGGGRGKDNPSARRSKFILKTNAGRQLVTITHRGKVIFKEWVRIKRNEVTTINLR